MPFFPQAYLPEAALMQFLSEINSPQPKSRPQCQPQPQPQPQPRQQQPEFSDPIIRLFHRPEPQIRVPTFTPRFDVTETAEAYELFGELPGLEKTDLQIEFVDAQTIVVKGMVDKVVTTSSASATTPEITSEKAVEQVREKEDVEAEEKDDEIENEMEKASLSATVEDDYDETDAPLTPSPAAVPTPSSTVSPSSPSPSSADKGKQPATASSSSSSSSTATEAASPVQTKYWLSERKTGHFARSFTFEQRIEQDFVTAGLKNGVLSVVVPKSRGGKRVVVSVL